MDEPQFVIKRTEFQEKVRQRNRAAYLKRKQRLQEEKTPEELAREQEAILEKATRRIERDTLVHVGKTIRAARVQRYEALLQDEEFMRMERVKWHLVDNWRVLPKDGAGYVQGKPELGLRSKEARGCYVWVDANGLCLYVGQTADLYRRHYQHAMVRQRMDNTRDLLVEQTKGIWYVPTCYDRALEVDLTATLKPLWWTHRRFDRVLDTPALVTQDVLFAALYRVHPLRELLK